MVYVVSCCLFSRNSKCDDQEVDEAWLRETPKTSSPCKLMLESMYKLSVGDGGKVPLSRIDYISLNTGNRYIPVEKAALSPGRTGSMKYKGTNRKNMNNLIW